jgi:hypothetical protein
MDKRLAIFIVLVFLFVILLFSVPYFKKESFKSFPPTIISNFHYPLGITRAKGDDNYFYAWDQEGYILRIKNNSPNNKIVSLDLRNQDFSLLNTNDIKTRKLIGLAIHPDFSQEFYQSEDEEYRAPPKDKRLAYISFNMLNKFIVREYKVDPEGKFYSPKHIIDIEYPSIKENGGQLKFGEDGYLYILTPETDYSDSLNVKNLRGKLLKIDINKVQYNLSTTDVINYNLPEDLLPRNENIIRPEIFAIGVNGANNFDIYNKRVFFILGNKIRIINDTNSNLLMGSDIDEPVKDIFIYGDKLIGGVFDPVSQTFIFADKEHIHFIKESHFKELWKEYMNKFNNVKVISFSKIEEKIYVCMEDGTIRDLDTL